MPKSLLEQFNEQMALAQQGTKQFAEAGELYRKRSAGEALRSALPGYLETPSEQGLRDLATLGTAAGDTTYADMLVKKQLDAVSPKKPALSYEELRTVAPYLSEPQAKMLSTKPYEEQEKLMSGARDFYGSQQKSKEFMSAEERRIEDVKGKVFNTRFGKLQQDLLDTKNDLFTMNELIKTGSVPSQGSLLSMVSRKIAGEKGVLTDTDIARLKNPTLGESLASFTNYITSNSQDTWPEDVRQAMKELVGVADSRFQNVINEKLGGLLNTATGNKLLFNKKEGNAYGELEALADEYGFKYNPKTGKFERGKPETIRTVDLGSMEKQAQSYYKQATDHKNPEVKSTVMKFIESKKGKKISDAQMEWIKNTLAIE